MLSLGFDKLEHARTPQEVLLGIEHIGDGFPAKRVSRHQRL
jgi:hypothetical protein